jgi:hypothetical protein
VNICCADEIAGANIFLAHERRELLRRAANDLIAEIDKFFFRTPASFKAATAAALSLATISGGVFAGTRRAAHVPKLNPGTPDSARVGISGSCAMRAGVVVARMRMRLSGRNCETVESAVNSAEAWPATTSVTADVTPR